MKRCLHFALLVLLLSASFARAEDDVVLKAMRDELTRSVEKLRLPNLEKPYFISYRVDDVRTTSVSATLGQLAASNAGRNRSLNVQVRVGDYNFDNTNYLTVRGFPRFFTGMRQLPLDDDYDEIRRVAWLATDAQYKKAAEELAAKKSILQHRQGTAELADFSKMPPTNVSEARASSNVDAAALEKLARDLSRLFRDTPEIFSSDVTITVNDQYTRFVNSEGTWFTRYDPSAAVVVRAQTQAPDGQPLSDSFSVITVSPEAFKPEALAARTRALIDRIKAQRTAKSLERYNGPVLFEGEAAAEVVSQVFAPGLVASRFPVTDEPQFESNMQQMMAQFGVSLADRLGGRVLPEWVDITDDPTQTKLGDVPLIGASRIDDEGVLSRPVKLVEGGMLKALLASRTPSPQAKESTGSTYGMGPSPSNFFFQTKKSQTIEELRKQLISMAKARGYDYGVVVRHVGESGSSFFLRMAGGSQGASGTATEVYKLYADGHEELLRGVEIAPVPVSAFRDIVAASDKAAVYNEPFIPLIPTILAGVGGGGGGGVSISSYVVPSILFEEVAVKQSTSALPKPPVVSSPLVAAK